MEANGIYNRGEELGINAPYSFKSLLLDDGEGLVEAGAAHIDPSGGLPGIEVNSLYRDTGLVRSGRESFKSLLLDDDEAMDDEEVAKIQLFPPPSNHHHHFRPANGSHHFQGSSLTSSSVTAAAAAKRETENSESFLTDIQGVDPSLEKTEVERPRPPSRKRKRSNNSSKAAAAATAAARATGGENINSSAQTSVVTVGFSEYTKTDVNEKQRQPLAALQQQLPGMLKNQAAEILKVLPSTRRRKQGGGGGSSSSSEVQKLLDSLVARQEKFFTDLLESMERKEAIRERIREEKEDRWRAEERFQRCLFNNAMLALTQEILSESSSRPPNGKLESIHRPKRADGASDH